MEFNKMTILYFVALFFFFFFSCTLPSTVNSKTPFLDNKSFLTGKASYLYQPQDLGKTLEKPKADAVVSSSSMARAGRLLLRGPESRPPSCVSHCGTCTPCEVVLVGNPGNQDSPDYKPQSWMCKCGGKLYNP